jgi:hypothetical protein
MFVSQRVSFASLQKPDKLNREAVRRDYRGRYQKKPRIV